MTSSKDHFKHLHVLRNSPSEPALLNERIAGTVEDCLCVVKRFNLVSTSLLAHFEVLQVPVTLTVERGNIFHGVHVLSAGIGLGFVLVLQRLLCRSFLGVLVCD